MARIAVLLPLLVAAAALGAATGTWSLAATLGSAAAALAWMGPRWELDRGRQMLTSAIGAGLGYAAAGMLHDPAAPVLAEGWTRFAAGALTAAAARALIIDPRGGPAATVAMAFASLLATGQTRGHGYAGFVALFLASASAALRAHGERRTAAVHGEQRTAAVHGERRTVAVPVTSRRLAMGGAIVLVAVVIGATTTAGVHRLHAFITSRARLRSHSWQPRVGFSDKMELGALDGLLDSDELVLRIRGGHVDYLRGAVLDRYEAGRWIRSEDASAESTMSFVASAVSAGLPAPALPAWQPAATVDVTAVKERTSRLFLPLAARDITTTPSTVLLDDLGALKRAADRGGLIRVRFVSAPRDRALPAAPRLADEHVPRRLRHTIEQLAADWTRGAVTPRDKVEAIERRLRAEYTYARAFRRGAHVDPALDFLTGDKRGHCEYFATALALLARGSGVPARMVVGYRVGEQSPFGYEVVRERNAHAWVEAWIDGAWSTRDATPSEALPQNRLHAARYGASWLDALLVAHDDITAWLGALSVAETASAWLVGSAILGWIVLRGVQKGRLAPIEQPGDASALPVLVLLLARAAQRGHLHRPDEPLEHFAARVPDLGAAALIRRYAALRYGSQGDASALAHDVAVYTNRPASAPRSSHR